LRERERERAKQHVMMASIDIALEKKTHQNYKRQGFFFIFNKNVIKQFYFALFVRQHDSSNVFSYLSL
jgi:hypothetical protein